MTLTKYGWKQWLPISVCFITVIALLSWVAQQFPWMWFIVASISLVWIAILSFFRNPWRRTPSNLPQGTMLSPADGVVSAIERLDTHEAVEGPAVIIRIFLSVLNVHINRAPCKCTLKEAIYSEGKFLDARTEESAKVNESNLLILDTGFQMIGVRQVSGKLAKRIVCPLLVGDSLHQGQQFGMITLGSTTELILPEQNGVDVLVTKGQSVRGGLTQVAILG